MPIKTRKIYFSYIFLYFPIFCLPLDRPRPNRTFGLCGKNRICKSASISTTTERMRRVGPSSSNCKPMSDGKLCRTLSARQDWHQIFENTAMSSTWSAPVTIFEKGNCTSDVTHPRFRALRMLVEHRQTSWLRSHMVHGSLSEAPIGHPPRRLITISPSKNRLSRLLN